MVKGVGMGKTVVSRESAVARKPKLSGRRQSGCPVGDFWLDHRPLPTSQERPRPHPQAWEECTTPSLFMITFLLQSLECSLHKPYEINVRAFPGLF